MKLRKLIQELEKIRLWLENEKKSLANNNYYEYIGFYPGLNPKITFDAFKKGWWSTFIFSYDNDVSFGLRIFPDKVAEEWPVVRNLDNYYAVTFSNSIKTFIPFQQVFALLDEDLFETISEDWETIMHLNAPLLTLFEVSPEDIEYIKKYAFIPENQPSGKKEDNISKYLEFWFHYDKSQGNSTLREIINQLNIDKKWLPDTVPNENLGIWETRIKNLLMSRAKSNRVIYGNEKIKDFIIEGFLQPHGYDAENIVFSQTPILNTSKNTIDAVANYFTIAEDIIPEDFLESHFFQAALAIDKSFNTYQGEEHYKAALVLESENKPLEAWNALVSASYWAGVNNSPENVEKHWQTAIKLCEKQNWTDALEALTYQWEWYQEHK